MMNALHVFLTGLPGGIDYLMLVAVKRKYMKSITEKYMNRLSNLLIRQPGALYVTTMIYSRGMYALSESNGLYTKNQFFLLMINVLLSIWNAIYFMERVVASYHVSNHKIIEEKKKYNELIKKYKNKYKNKYQKKYLKKYNKKLNINFSE